ncbi:hypothetical protein [Sphaerisporangium sp. TRM90804]|uniref:hypothetical protein n=1 Tax=Sphaerisporangium sp. TRM90804 TaxID=3031113 RepID=UPI0024497994|nr:hypothetical protein [Sphaerisporangium sp. TRM90804]MDH2428217.1 hypothetical protein [Sphaerisporangium sp. TRM90804]
MRRLAAVPAYAPRHKVRDIRSAHDRRPSHDTKVVHLQAYTGRNVIRFPRPGGSTPAA